MFVIPTTSDPNQNFRCTIPVNGENMPFDITLRYNWIAGYWSMSLADAVSGQVLLAGAPLIAGLYPAANLLSQHEHLRIGACCIVKTNPDNPDDAPDGDNLGIDFQLVWTDNLEEARP